jgi:hypothetical protein
MEMPDEPQRSSWEPQPLQEVIGPLLAQLREALSQRVQRTEQRGETLLERLASTPVRAEVETDDIISAESIRDIASLLKLAAEQSEALATTTLGLTVLQEGMRRRFDLRNLRLRWMKDHDKANAAILRFAHGLPMRVRRDLERMMQAEGGSRFLSRSTGARRTLVGLHTDKVVAALIFYLLGLKQVELAALYQITQPAINDWLARFDDSVAYSVLQATLKEVATAELWVPLDESEEDLSAENVWVKGSVRLRLNLWTVRSEQEDLLLDLEDVEYGSPDAVALYDLSTRAAYLVTLSEFRELASRRPKGRFADIRDERVSLDGVSSRLESSPEDEGGDDAP